MKEIPLTQGQVALVDDADYPLVGVFKWHARKHRNTFYAVRTWHDPKLHAEGKNGTRHQSMHALLLGMPGGDHKNHNGCDNRRENLRAATALQNRGNQTKRKDGQCPYKGVGFHKQMKKWRAYSGKDGKYVHLGLFESAEEAARAYDEYARQYFGEFALLNFPI